MTVDPTGESNYIPSPTAGAVLARSAGDSSFATTLAKGLVVLEAFDAGTPLLGNMELAARTGMPRPTVARLTRTLAEIGYLRYDPDVAKYCLAPRALRMAHPLLAGMPFRQTARPLMQSVAESLRGTVSIGVLDGTAMIYVEAARGGDVSQFLPDTGMPMPVVTTAMGRAAASILPPEESRLLETQLRAHNTDLWVRHRDRYLDGLDQCARQGFCTSPGEYSAATHAAAAPLLHDHHRNRFFAINCSVPALQIRSGQLEQEIGPRIRALAGEIRQLLNEPEPVIGVRY